jgi:Sulfotransferase domain
MNRLSKRPEWPQQKVFCVGMHKSGTSSFHQLMSDLGARSLHSTRRSMAALGLGADNSGEEGDGTRSDLAARIDAPMLQTLVDQYDCFSDNPWPLLYRRLDVAFPGSRFVLTVRDTEKWLRSQTEDFGAKNTQMRQWIYGFGNPLRHAERYREVYEQHACDVRRYFAHRSDFLELRLEDDNRALGAQLWTFLGLAGEPRAFPHRNVRRGVSR